ncbi:hypothetical protein IQ16_03721 [Bradyrhizobium huanghuaihaiense]|uniref:Uncharacterized protein n=1 Tax=Bradyrhizobium huanghuaihaiense TaxID=990078 RepID=A0A562RNA2_9BRAD|nr:hypothetical protein [Bradyrhizobium huanghuaihaiense]TWI70548.1 hypothetical protein IQ16_03721 [Bradyrhizobium huanghuaihaiense]
MAERNYADREQNEADINSLYGFPGEGNAIGDRLYSETQESFGPGAFKEGCFSSM